MGRSLPPRRPPTDANILPRSAPGLRGRGGRHGRLDMGFRSRGDRLDGRSLERRRLVEVQAGTRDLEGSFLLFRDLAAHGKTLVVPAGGRVVFLEDAGDRPRLRLTGLIPNFNGSEYPAAFGLSLGPEGEAYVQWHRRDNAGRVEVLRLRDDDTLETSFVPGTQTAINCPAAQLLSGQHPRPRCVPLPAGRRFGILQARPRQRSAADPGRLSVDRPSRAASRSSRCRRIGRAAVCGAVVGPGDCLVVRDSVGQTDHRGGKAVCCEASCEILGICVPKTVRIRSSNNYVSQRVPVAER